MFLDFSCYRGYRACGRDKSATKQDVPFRERPALMIRLVFQMRRRVSASVTTGDEAVGLRAAAIVGIRLVLVEQNAHAVRAAGEQTRNHVAIRVQNLQVLVHVQTAAGAVNVRRAGEGDVVFRIRRDRAQTLELARILAECVVLRVVARDRRYD